jgi:flagellar protein FlbT
MALTLTLKPNERIVVNGCAMRNSGRRHVIMIESHADVVRGQDLLDESDAATPVGKAYYLIQTVLIRADLRDKLVPLVQQDLAALATVFGGENLMRIFEAANYVSQMDYYKALRALRPVIKHEARLLSGAATKQPPDTAQERRPDAAAGGVAR